jgi:ankyrin repeat protein
MSTLIKTAKSLAELDVDSLLLPNADGDLPLHIAIIRNDMHTPLARFLLERYPEAARATRRNGNLAIHDAIERRLLHLVRDILRFAPETAGFVGANGRSPLHVAVALPLALPPHWNRNVRKCTVLGIVDLLVEISPGSLIVRDRNGDLPLHIAISSSWQGDSTVELGRTLLERCPQSVREADAGGNLPCHLAVSTSSPFLPLVRLGVDRWLESLEERDAGGNVTLVLAAANESASLDLIYWLARATPDLVCRTPSGQVQQGKRRRVGPPEASSGGSSP